MYDERLRLNYNKKLSISVFNEEKIDISYLKPKMYGKFLIQISNLWINKETNQYGIIWNISQIKLYSNLIYNPADYSFVEHDTPKTVNVSETDPKYKQYFFMLKIGLSKEAVEHKLKKDNIDENIINFILGKKENKIITPDPPKYETVKKKDNARINLFNDIKKGITLNKVKINDNTKKKIILPHNNLVPSEDDIISALNNLKKIY